MILFWIVRWGGYMSGVYGCFERIQDAINAAADLAHAEPDDYHMFQVIPIELNKAYANNTILRGGDHLEIAALATIRRSGLTVTVELSNGQIVTMEKR